MQATRRSDPGATASAALAVTVHLMLFVVLFFGIRWRTKQPEPVMAELWRELPAIEAPRPAPPRVEPKPEPKPPPEPKAEPKPEPKPDIALEQERKRKEEAEKKRREEAEQKRREEAELKRREEAEKKKREDEAKAKAEAERKERELAAARRREAQEAERKRMQDQLARELASAAPRSAVPGTPTLAADPAAVEAWQGQISAKVRSNIVLPPDLVGNPEAVFDVFLLPTGEVQSVRLVRSSGNKVLDDAWERAILKSSPLPRPARPEIFRRELKLVFRPRE